jgi:hypothetical protein
MAARYGFVLTALVCTGAFAAQPPPQPPTPLPPTKDVPSDTDVPDDDFIEFLGGDDVGDAAWWEFLKKAAPRKDQPIPVPPPQDAKQ